MIFHSLILIDNLIAMNKSPNCYKSLLTVEYKLAIKIDNTYNEVSPLKRMTILFKIQFGKLFVQIIKRRGRGQSRSQN